MFQRKKSRPNGRIDSLIGAGTRIVGDVSFSGGLRIDGEVTGNVVGVSDQSTTLIVSANAKIEGEIHVAHVVLNGTVTGPIYSTESLELQGRSRVSGDVHYNTLEMHLGAIIEGRLVHQTSAVAKTVELKIAARG